MSDGAIANGNTVANGRTLFPNHLADLRASGLSDETIRRAGLYSEHRYHDLEAALNWQKMPKKMAPALMFPFHRPDGSYAGYTRAKPDNPRLKGGKKVKYESPVGRDNEPYFPHGIGHVLQDSSAELVLTEGEKKALAVSQTGFHCIGLVGIWGWKTGKGESLLPSLSHVSWKGRNVFIAFDSDASTNEQIQDAERRLAALLATRGAKVRIARLPEGPTGDDGKPTKVGLDDFLVAHGANGPRELRKLLDAATVPEPPSAISTKQHAKDLDPFSATTGMIGSITRDGVSTLAFWGGAFLRWQHGRYAEVQTSEVRAFIVRKLNRGYFQLGSRHASDCVEQLRAACLLSGLREPPFWIDKPPILRGDVWPVENVLVAKNGLVHLPSLFAGEEYFHPPTPSFFSLTSLDYDFPADPRTAPPATRWLEFLAQLWPEDRQSIDLLQEWFGLSLVPDTSFQKALLLVGPKRSGKGTIARIQRAMVGAKNTAAPTLASFGERFGLWGLVGKLLAVVGDARLSGKADQAPIVERLLSISGEDGLDVDRKNLEPLLAYTFPTRLMLLSNELPRLTDSSGALPSRFLLLQLSESFLGRENRSLTRELMPELPSILLWAIRGWERLVARGHFSQPDSALETLQDLADLSSPVGTFVRQCCVVEAGRSIVATDLYASWRAWCETQGWKECTTAATFGRDLAAAAPSVRRRRFREGEARPWTYEGIDTKVRSSWG